MEGIKNRMEALVKQKDESNTATDNYDEDVRLLKQRAEAFQKQVHDITREQAKLDGEYDTVMTNIEQDMERLEIANNTATDSELQASALVRQVQLQEEEAARVDERLQEVVSRLTIVEKSAEDNERQRKILEANSFAIEERGEILELQVVEAKIIAEEANRKEEDASRKLRMIENELDRITDRADEFENKARGYELKLNAETEHMKELEDLAYKNGEKEDKMEEQMHDLIERLKDSDTRAEFSERTVEKLESTIDNLTDMLYCEKVAFSEMSKKLDQTLKDMMKLV